MSAPDDPILFERRGALGLVTLNRPRQLNALTHAMAAALGAQLLRWRDDDAVKAVAIRGAGERAFCAGGDIRLIWEAGLARGLESAGFYADEYRVNHLIRFYPKPYVAFMDGIVMGGGVGVSIHGSHRLAGDRTLFAMPETGIGLFPDVGGTWFLPRMPGETGMWLGLTGARLGPADAVAAGACDLYAPSDRHSQALAALADGVAPEDALVAVAAPPPEGGTLDGLRESIDRCFGGDSVAAVLEALAAEGTDWATAQRAEILKKSPTSTLVTFLQIRAGRGLDFAGCMALEYRLARFCMTRPDFYEGVRAAVIDKDGAPCWSPRRLEDVDPAEIDAAFAPLPEGVELTFP
jgi:enoyl-CoA hydratase